MTLIHVPNPTCTKSQEEALALFSSKEKLCKISLEYSKELTQAVRIQKKTQINDVGAHLRDF
jgi:hypothetical protein